MAKYTPANAPLRVRRRWARAAWSPAARKLRACRRDLKRGPAAPSRFDEAPRALSLDVEREIIPQHPARVDLPNPHDRFDRDGDGLARRPRTTTLREWIQKSGVRPIKDTGDTVAFAQFGPDIDPYKNELWWLKDYYVSGVSGGAIWLGRKSFVKSNPELLVVTNNPHGKRSTAMRRRRKSRRRNGKLTVRIGGRRRSWKSLVKQFGVKGAKRKWRGKKKYSGKCVVSGGGRRRRKSRGRRRSARGKKGLWKRLVKRWGVKGAKKRYRKGRR